MKLDGHGINISAGGFFQNSESRQTWNLCFYRLALILWNVFYETYTPDCRNCVSMGRGLCVGYGKWHTAARRPGGAAI